MEDLIFDWLCVLYLADKQHKPRLPQEVRYVSAFRRARKSITIISYFYHSYFMMSINFGI